METIRECFKLFVQMLKKDINVNICDIHEIQNKTNIMYMQYIVEGNKICIFDSNVYHAYEHLMKMINDLQKNKCAKLEELNLALMEENRKLQEENDSYKNTIFFDPENVHNATRTNSELRLKPNSWFTFK